VCGLVRLPDEAFHGGVCPACNADRAKKRRGAVGRKLLARARNGGVEVRDGQTFRVAVLPPTRRRSRRR
jgi:hypothetical protein